MDATISSFKTGNFNKDLEEGGNTGIADRCLEGRRVDGMDAL